MKDPNSNAIFPIITLALLLLSWRATSDSSPSVEKFIKCIKHTNSPVLESIYTPNNSSFVDVLQSRIRNRRFWTPQTPQLVAIVAPTEIVHVAATVICANESGFQIRIRSGGHDYEGLSYRSNVTFVVLDMFNLRSIHVDVDKKVATVQAGASIGELYYHIAKKNNILGFPAGVCPGLGAGGHFSGGGYGNMMRKYGMSADNIVDAEVVDSRGHILDRSHMGEDYFWAIRGGGGASFGVVVSWKIKLVPVPPKVTVFNVNFTLQQGATDLAFKWQQVAPKLPEDLFIRLIASAKNGTVVVNFMGFFLGGTQKVVPLVTQSFPELKLREQDCKEMSWLESTLFWASIPIGTPVEALLNRTNDSKFCSKCKSDYVKTVIPKEGLETIWKMLIDLKNTTNATLMMMQWNPYGGKMSTISESFIPFPHRSEILFLSQYLLYWLDEGVNVSNRNLDKFRSMHDKMAPFVSKEPREVYLNYRDNDIGSTASDKTNFADAQIYGTKYFKNNFQRLTMVKANVDPTNFFKHEQSIPLPPKIK